MSKIGLITFTAAIALAGVSYAGEKITLVCSGSVSVQNGEEPFSPTGLGIDLDGGKVTWAGSTLPITENKGNFISFKGDEDAHNSTISGTIDRVSGGLGLVELFREGGSATYDLHCSPTKPLF
jgi:hypothetical protein